MYAIVEIAGQQFKVEEGKKIYVHRLDAEKDSIVNFDRVLLIDDNDRIIIGEPVIKDAVVQGKILEDVRGDKVIVFKKKRRKGYRVRNGHRQDFTHIEIVGINEKGMPKKGGQDKATAEPAISHEGETKEVEVTVRSAGKTVKKESVEGKSAAKKTVVKKSAVKESTEKRPAGEKAAAKKSPVKKSSAKKPSGEKK